MSTTPSSTIPQDAVLVSENILRKRKDADKLRVQKQAEAVERQAKKKNQRKAVFQRAEKYVKDYRELEREKSRVKRVTKNEVSVDAFEENKLVFVVRIKGIKKIPTKPKKVLQLLRLTQVNSGVFLKVTKATSELLQLIEPYVAYGYPNLASIRQLIYKRGYGKIDNKRVPLTDNAIIEEHLGKYGIICLEDLIHEIFAGGPNFKQANNFLFPFKLSSPTGGWGVRSKFKHFLEGGVVGNRGEDINELITAQN